MSDPRIGSDVAGFRITSVLGHGGMGTVYVAQQSSPRRKVALKLLRADLSADEAFRRRFEHESEAAAATEHPNIVPIYASGESDGVLYIAMRFVEGTDLRDAVASGGPMPPDRAVEVVSQIAGALDSAHRRGLVHRDVKPGNILLDEHGNGYLTDFGLIKRSEVSTGITKTGQFMGSIEYCAPEQIRGEEVDGRADVYSLACVLYECLAGSPPFKRETEVATLYAHLEQEPPQLPASIGAPGDLDRVLAKGMAKRPADRYATAGELARGARHAAGVTSGEREAVPSTRRRGLAWAGAAIAVAVAVLVGALALLLGGDEGDTGPVATGATSATGSAAGTHTVARLDPETGEVVQAVGGFSIPGGTLDVAGLAVGEGGVWVGAGSVLGGNVVHVDPVTGGIRATIDLLSSMAIAVPAVDFRTVWVTTGGAAIERINPATDELLRPIRLTPVGELPPSVLRTWIATGEGRVWVADASTVIEVDPVQNRVVREIDVGGVTGLAVGEGGVWVTDGLAGELLRIDPGSGEETGSASLPGGIGDVAAGGGRVWVLDKGAGTVAVVDPTNLEIQDTIRVGGDERNLVFGAGALWLADGDDASLTRIDPDTLRVDVFPVGASAELVAVGSDSGEVWVLLAL